MSDAKRIDQATNGKKQVEQKTRSRTVKPGHLEVGEFTSGRIGGPSPFGNSNFPLPVSSLYFESSKPVAPRILDDERH
ncbi:hypothetical protein [Glycomyces buryatensis]|uniref:Uncharacterized protein n=1 Tax=Glycomyces buryatensis TaxID=2570927 RepID=A0A4S8QJI9_9ACTN|nr:hypothetical protein [Glycomyces buryatensis]THV43432.1 hypothetical protein FAB82_01805 [Glycomyces buryatensis]